LNRSSRQAFSNTCGRQVKDQPQGRAATAVLLPAIVEGLEHVGSEIFPEGGWKQEQEHADNVAHQPSPSGSSFRGRANPTTPASRAASFFTVCRPDRLMR